MNVEGSSFKFQRIAASLGEIAKASESGSAKSYVTIKKGQLSVELGKSAKESKTLDANELSKLILAVTQEAAKEGIISKKTDLTEMIQGIEILKGRITSRRNNINPIKKFIIELFQLEDKSQNVLDRMNVTLTILKQYSLEKETDDLRGKIIDLENQIPKLPPPGDTGIKKEKEFLTQKLGLDPSHNDLRANINEAVKAIEPRGKNAPQGVYKELLASLKRLESYEAANAERKEKFVELKNKKTEFAEKQRELVKLREQNLEIVTKTKTTFIVPTKTPAKTQANQLLDAISQRTNDPQGVKARQIKTQLGYTSAESPAYFQYQQKLIFGFSVGQRQTLDELKKLGVTKAELENMLEGGDAVTNMFYLANAIEQQIENAIGKSPQYLEKLKSIHADLMRSLPIAMEISILDGQITQSQSEMMAKIRKQQSPLEMKVSALSQNVSDQLQQMKPGQSLYIPVGTKDHAVMLRLQKTNEEKILPSLYNTGLGAREHQDLWNQWMNLFNENEFSPLKVDYPSFALNDLTNKLSDIFTNRMRNDSVEQLYTKALEKLGRPIPGPAKKEQINGVCSFQVLTAILEDNFEEKEHHQFQHDFLTQLGNDFSKMSDGLKINTSTNSERTKELSDNEKMALSKKLHNAILEDNSREIQRLKVLL